MKTKTETNGPGMFQVFVKYFAAAMSLVYLAAGVFLLLRGDTSFNMPHYYSVPLGLLLALYGVFRGYRVYKKYFEHYEDD